MLLASVPIIVVMQRRTVSHPWANDVVWSAIGVAADLGGIDAVKTLHKTDREESYLVPGLRLELHPDENDGYFENWVAPEPKVFVMWRMQNERAMPVLASVSYGEGTRMLDSGESTDGVIMPPDIHLWLAEYLQVHYQPRQKRGHGHR